MKSTSKVVGTLLLYISATNLYAQSSAEIQWAFFQEELYVQTQTVYFNVQVKNTGTTTLSGLWLNVDISNPSGDNVREGWWKDIPTLGPTETYSTNYSSGWQIPQDAQIGLYQAAVGLRDASIVYDIEFQIDNFTTIESNPNAEIQMADIEYSTYDPSENILLDVKVKNIGNLTLTDLWLNVDIADPNGFNVVEGKWQDIPTLEPDDTYQTNYDEIWITPPDAKPGSYAVSVGLRDNERIYQIELGADNFTVNELKSANIISANILDDTYQEHDEVTLSVNVQNTGNVILPNMWLNVDISDPDGTNIREGWWIDLPSLDPKENYDTGYLPAWVVPEGAAEGIYNVAVGMRDADLEYDIEIGIDQFSIEPFSLPFPISSGVIVYHNYSNLNAWDGNLFTYDFSSNTLIEISADWNIDHAINAHFSPDGNLLVFMGDNKGEPRDWDIFIWEVGSAVPPSNLTHSYNQREEDPKFSPDGTKIVFKQRFWDSSINDFGWDLKEMNIEGNIINTITAYNTYEESMPYYTSDGNHIVYSRDTSLFADIYKIDIDGSNNVALFAELNIQEMYPIIIDENTFLYTRWVSADDKIDQIYLGNFSTGLSSPLQTNELGAEDADPYPIPSSKYIFFSSTRSGLGSYDLFLGDIETGDVWPLTEFGVNSQLKELGVAYSPGQVAKVIEIVTDVESVTVPEGGTNTFQVKLSQEPSSTTTVNVSRYSGDSDISVTVGASLTFTTLNYGSYQSVTLSAAEDADITNGTAIIRASSSGLSSKDVTATEVDNDILAIVSDKESVTVLEGGTATFGLKLSQEPSSTTTVNVSRYSGDSDISVTVGASLTFTTLNYGSYQSVTLSAAEDADISNGIAIIRASSSGLSNKNITATEVDNDVMAIVSDNESVTVPEGGTATFRLKLSQQPSVTTTVNASRYSGDSDINVTGGSSLSFTTSNWNSYKTVTISAAEDVDITNGTAIIRASSSGLSNKDVTATEADNDITPPGLFSQNLWVLNNGDPDYSNPPFDDSLKVYNSAGEKILSRGGFNIAQTIGGHRAIAISDDGKVGWITENIGDRLTIININGDVLSEVPIPVYSLDVVASGFAYALTSIGLISGDSVLIIDPDGSIVNRAKYGGFDLVVDEEHSSVWIVGTDIKRLNLNLGLEMSIDPIEWAAVSVDFDSKGNAWIAERQHPDIPDSKNRIIRVSPVGLVIDSVDLVNYSPLCIRVDRESGDVWTVGTDFIYRYNPDLTELVLIESVGGFSLDVDYTEGLIWIGSYEDVRAYSRDGNLQTTLSDFDGTDIKYVVTSDVRPITTVIVSDNESVTIPEGGTATFRLKLSQQPSVTTTVNVSRYSGDSHISVTGGASRTFTTSNWNSYQTVTVSAAEDADITNGSAIIRASSSGLSNKDITATEVDNDGTVTEILDQYQTNNNYGFGIPSGSDRWQQFIPNLNNISIVQIIIGTVTPTGYLTLKIQSEDGVTTFAEEIIAASELPSDDDWIEVVLENPVELISGLPYRITLRRDQSHSPDNAIYWSGHKDSKYPGYSDPDPDSQENIWDNYDYAFRTYGHQVVSIAENETSLPEKFSLSQNYPNPFNPITKIEYSLPEPRHVKLVVYNIHGDDVKRLVDQQMQAGYHYVEWDASGFATGVYFYRLTVRDWVLTKKMVLLK